MVLEKPENVDEILLSWLIDVRRMAERLLEKGEEWEIDEFLQWLDDQKTVLEDIVGELEGWIGDLEHKLEELEEQEEE